MKEIKQELITFISEDCCGEKDCLEGNKKEIWRVRGNLYGLRDGAANYTRKL